MAIDFKERLRREVEHGATETAIVQADFGWDSPAGKIRRERRGNFLIKDIAPHARVLEIGAGTGLQTMAILEVTRDVVAIDISPELLERARLRAPGARYEVMDAHYPSGAAESFDAIVGVSILHHLDWGLALKNYLPLLKRGGIVRFSEPNLLNPQIYLQKNIPFIKRLAGDSPDEYAFTRWQIAKILKDAGYVDIHVEAYEFLHPGTPQWLIPYVVKLESFLARTPAREIGGSLLIEARKP